MAVGKWGMAYITFKGSFPIVRSLVVFQFTWFRKLFHTQLAGEWSWIAMNHFDMFIQSLGYNLLAAYVARSHFSNFLPMRCFCVASILRPPPEYLTALRTSEVLWSLVRGFVLQELLIGNKRFVAQVTDKAFMLILHMTVQICPRRTELSTDVTLWAKVLYFTLVFHFGYIPRLYSYVYRWDLWLKPSISANEFQLTWSLAKSSCSPVS